MPTEVISQLYNVAAVFATPSPATGYCFSSGNSGDNLIKQIPRVQSVGMAFSRPLEPINQIGQFAAIDRIQVNAPTATVNLEYMMLDGKAEDVLGFNTAGNASFISGFLDRTTAEKNIYCSLSAEGIDNISATDASTTRVLGVGNTYVTSYSANLAIGQIPRATVSLEGFNFGTYTGSANQDSVAIDTNTDTPVSNVLFTVPAAISYTGANIATALRPGELELQFPTDISPFDFASGVGSMKINSVSVSMNPSPDSITALGHMYPIAKKITRPVDVSLSIDATQSDVNNSSLATLRCTDSAKNMRIVMHKPGCGPTGAASIIMDLKGFKLESRDNSISVGGGAGTVRLGFTAQMGAGSDVNNGLIFSGSHQFVTGL